MDAACLAALMKCVLFRVEMSLNHVFGTSALLPITDSHFHELICRVEFILGVGFASLDEVR